MTDWFSAKLPHGDITFIVGNGPSRINFDINLLLDKGTVWGCNAAYRDFTPHYLMAVDNKMQQEIIASKYPDNNKCFFRTTKQPIKPHPNIKYWDLKVSTPNNSGIASIYHALKMNSRTIYLLGFDLVDTPKGELCNVYAGTPCYEHQKRKPPPIRSTISEKISWWTTHNLGVVKFYRVGSPPISLEGFNEPYMTNITYDEMICQIT